MDIQVKKFYLSMVFPSIFLLFLWLIKIVEVTGGHSFSNLGIYPLNIESFIGILFAPMIHGDFSHLIANSSTLWVLMVGLFYFYSPISFKVFFFIYFASGLWVWSGARYGYHIGASGLIYGLAAFLSISGIIKNHVRLMAIALIVIFLYGGLLWGLLPNQAGISWESHLLGGVAGVVISFFYRKTPVSVQMPLFSDFKQMTDDDVDDSNPYWQTYDNEYFTFTNRTDNPKNK